MTKEQTNKFLTLLMGQKYNGNLYSWYCPTCHEFVENKAVTYSETHDVCGMGVVGSLKNPDFSTPADFLEYMRWAGKQSWFWSMVGNVEYEIDRGISLPHKTHKIYTNTKWSLEQQIKWYRNNKDLWGYEECPECDGKGEYISNGIVGSDHDGFPIVNTELEGTVVKCPICDNGRIKTKALKYLEEVEG